MVWCPRICHRVPRIPEERQTRLHAWLLPFKAKPNTYSLGLAPTSRATCRACKRVVGKGEARVVMHAFIRPGRGTYFVRHVCCATASFVSSMLEAHGSVERVPTDSRAWTMRLRPPLERCSSSSASPHDCHEAVWFGHHAPCHQDLGGRCVFCH